MDKFRYIGIWLCGYSLLSPVVQSVEVNVTLKRRVCVCFRGTGAVVHDSKSGDNRVRGRYDRDQLCYSERS